MFKKVVHAYDRVGDINLINRNIHDYNFEPHETPQLFYSGFGHYQEVHCCENIDKIDFEKNKDTLYLYVLEPYGSFSWFIGSGNKLKPVIYQIPSHIIKMFQEIPNFYLCVQSKHEGTYHDNDISVLQRQVQKMKIPANKVVLSILDNWVIDDMYDKMVDRFQYQQKMNIHSFPTFMVHKGLEIINENYYKDVDINKLLIEKRTHKMLYYNHRIRKPHRFTLLLLMMKEGMFKDNLVSYNLEFAEERDQYPNLIYPQFTSQAQSWEEQFSQEDWDEWYPKFLSTKKSILDEENYDSLSGFHAEFPETYKRAYVSLVSESMFFEKHRFVSEKPYKCFNHFHPFILMGGDGSIKKLKEQGFKTWDNWWDESYDEITDDNERYKKVVELVRFINNKSLDELHEMYQEMIPNLKFNHEKMISIGKDFKKLYKKYYDDNLIGVVNENL